MSLSQNARQVLCDGTDCHVQAPAPVALRPTLAGSDSPPAAGTEGWLFVTAQGRSRHYCPACAPRYLDQLTDPKENVYV